jgi:hypothetical protein
VSAKRFGLVAVAVLAVSLACRRGEALSAVDEKQKTIALAAVRRLEQSLANGSCESIRDQAAGAFRRPEVWQEWLERCAQFQARWGEWKSFEPDYWYVPHSKQVAGEGVSQFSRGTRSIQIVWDMEQEPPRMLVFMMSGSRDRFSVPRGFEPLHVDPLRPSSEGSPAHDLDPGSIDRG